MKQTSKKQLIFDIGIKLLERTEQAVEDLTQDRVEEAITLINQRDELINIIGSYSDKELKELFTMEERTQLSQLINKIFSLDDHLVDLLTRHKEGINNEIANLFKKKENFKGYNLNNIK